jgi:uncharacterized protein (PEP-CTERM system associated)
MATSMTMQRRRLDSVGVARGSRLCAAFASVATAACALPLSAIAQGVLVQPRLSISQTATDNLKLTDKGKDAALITTVAPGISISSNSGRVQGFLDYSLNGLIYTKADEANTRQNSLSAVATVEAVENWLFLDARANMSQQVVSAFGVISADPKLNSGNQSEVSTLSLAPRIKGMLGGLMNYDLRADATETRAKDSITGDLSSRSASAQFSGLSQGLLNWSAALSTLQSQPRGGRDTQSTSATATLRIKPDYDWNFGLTAGQERNDYSSTTAETNATYGVNASWSPTPRTQLVADWMHHNYGNSHTLNFEHRMARTVFRLTDSQSANNGGPQNALGVQTNYDLLFIQLAAVEPNPVRRDVLVRNMLNSLGLSPNGLAGGGFLNASTSLSRRQEFAILWQGVRTTMTLSINQSTTNSLGTSTGLADDDLSRSGKIRQRVASANMAYRLTPTDTATLVISRQQNRGDLNTQRSDLTSLSANWSGRLGIKTTVQLGLRHSSFDSPQQPYRENAVLASLVQQF